jgi:hypothetical protein
MFSGPGYDAMWTDMSEIVRPTRDGIHGREFISTSVDIGEHPAFLRFDAEGRPTEASLPTVVTLPIPYILEAPPESLRTPRLLRVLATAAERLETLAVLPVRDVVEQRLGARHVAPLVGPEDRDLLARLDETPRLLEMEGWDAGRLAELRSRFPGAVVAVRVAMDADLLPMLAGGARTFHLVADGHGRAGGRFALDLIRAAHEALVASRHREEVTLLGSGGIGAAEHVPKAILCGLDAVGLDAALWVALQARWGGNLRDRRTAAVRLPRFDESWGVQRLANLVNAWRDQLLEILGAMGLREVRRLRGEAGRCMLQGDLEAEAFAGIEGFAG